MPAHKWYDKEQQVSDEEARKALSQWLEQSKHWPLTRWTKENYERRKIKPRGRYVNR